MSAKNPTVTVTPGGMVQLDLDRMAARFYLTADDARALAAQLTIVADAASDTAGRAGVLYRETLIRTNCATCARIAAEGGFGPSHKASPRCRSGGYDHCSCDTCF